ncbi:MAG: hypothetical protein ACE5EE_10140 [Fidelibacterota bacterium]
MSSKWRNTFDLRLAIQVAVILFAVVMAYASLTNHVDNENIHQGYEELAKKFVTSREYGNFKEYLDKRLDRIETLIVDGR